MRAILCSCLVVVALVGCNKKRALPSVEDHPSVEMEKGHMPSMNGTPGPRLEAGERRALGEAMPEDEQPLSKGELLDTCLDQEDECLVAARIGASCTHSGCWFTLVGSESDDLVLVEMEDEAFTMPINAAGSDIVAMGTLRKQEFTKAQSYYFLKEGARELGLAAPNKEDAPTEGYLFAIRGAVIQKPEGADAPVDHMDHDHMHHDDMDHEHMHHDDMDHGD